MSGSGGFYKYRCKNFYSHNCPNWVWVNNSPCATCLAEGKGTKGVSSMPSSVASQDIVVPRVQNGVLQYKMMEIVASDEPGESWTLRDKEDSLDGNPQTPPPTSAMPGSHGSISRW